MPAGPNRVPRRWTFAVVAVAIQLCLGAGYSWSVFRLPIQNAYGWSYAETAEPFRFLLLAYTVGMTTGGILQDRFGPRLIATIGGLVLGFGCLLGAVWGRTPASMVVGYATLAGLGMGLGYQPALAVLIKWFPDRRGMIVGLAVAGFGAGPLVSAPMQAWLLGTDPLDYPHTIPKTFAVMAVAFAVVVVGLAQALRNPPRSSDTAAVPVPGGSTDMTAREMLRTWQFYVLWTLLLFATSIGLAAVSEAAPYLERSSSAGAWLPVGVAVGLMGLCNGLGRLVSGAVSDRVGRKVVLTVVFALFVAACALLALPGGFTRCFAGMCLAGFCFGGGIAMMPSSNADYFGTRNVGGNYGIMFTGFAVSGFVVPWLVAGIVQAQSESGAAGLGYTFVFAGLGALAICGLVLAALLSPPRRRVRL